MSAKHPSKQNIKVAVDTVILTVQRGELKVLLIQMKKKPFSGKWAVPGGLLGEKELCETAAERILKQQTGVSEKYLDQLKTFDDAKRDPLGRVISVAYYALISSEGVRLKTTEKYADVRWWPVKKLPPLAYDHSAVVKETLKRVQGRLEYTNIVYSLLPEHFTLTDLQSVYEIILGKEIDKRNFRRKILSLGLLESTGKKVKGEAYRPAELYKFKKRSLEFVQVV